MGAFSFAVDTLSSLSSAFASKKPEPLASVSLSKLTLELDDQAQRLFEEFSTGMKMLYRHGSRNPCNVTHISQQNAKLLHTNLKANPSFKSSLARIKESASVTDQWAWLPLVSNQDIDAGFLFLPSNTSLSPNKSGGSLTMHQNKLQAPFSKNPFNSHLYLTLEGCPEVEVQQSFSTSSIILLKPGDCYATTCASSNVNQIRATQKHSLILSIQLSTS